MVIELVCLSSYCIKEPKICIEFFIVYSKPGLEYTDCILSREVRLSPTKNRVSWVWLLIACDGEAPVQEIWRIWNYLFITITPKPTLGGNESTC